MQIPDLFAKIILIEKFKLSDNELINFLGHFFPVTFSSNTLLENKYGTAKFINIA